MTDEQQQRHYPWADGLPTGPDVDALMKRWPEPAIGDRFAYSDVEEVIGAQWSTNRFSTVTDAWRKRLKNDKGLVVECERGEAFYVANTEQIVGKSHSVLSGIVRSAKRQRHNLALTRPENEDELRIVQHQGQLMNAIEKDARKQRMNLLPTNVPETPRIQPPDAKQN